MDNEEIDSKKASEIEQAFLMGGNEAVYMLGKADQIVSVIEYLRLISQRTTAREEAMKIMLEDYTDVVEKFHAVKVWIAENLSEIDSGLGDILMSVDTSEV